MEKADDLKCVNPSRPFARLASGSPDDIPKPFHLPYGDGLALRGLLPAPSQESAPRLWVLSDVAMILGLANPSGIKIPRTKVSLTSGTRPVACVTSRDLADYLITSYKPEARPLLTFLQEGGYLPSGARCCRVRTDTECTSWADTFRTRDRESQRPTLRGKEKGTSASFLSSISRPTEGAVIDLTEGDASDRSSLFLPTADDADVAAADRLLDRATVGTNGNGRRTGHASDNGNDGGGDHRVDAENRRHADNELRALLGPALRHAAALDPEGSERWFWPTVAGPTLERMLEALVDRHAAGHYGSYELQLFMEAYRCDDRIAEKVRDMLKALPPHLRDEPEESGDDGARDRDLPPTAIRADSDDSGDHRHADLDIATRRPLRREERERGRKAEILRRLRVHLLHDLPFVVYRRGRAAFVYHDIPDNSPYLSVAPLRKRPCQLNSFWGSGRPTKRLRGWVCERRGPSSPSGDAEAPAEFADPPFRCDLGSSIESPRPVSPNPCRNNPPALSPTDRPFVLL